MIRVLSTYSELDRNYMRRASGWLLKVLSRWDGIGSMSAKLHPLDSG